MYYSISYSLSPSSISITPIPKSHTNNFMAKCTTFPILFLFLVFPQPLLSQENNFVRQPASQLIITPHQRSNSEPQQVHISLVGKDKMKVSWITEDKGAKTVVEYGKKPGVYDKKTFGEKTSYQYFFYKSGRIHNAVIGPLEANTSYFYRCGGLGPEFSFKTPPSKFPIEFVIVGKFLLLHDLASVSYFS